MKYFCEISFKNQALKIKNEIFLRDFLQGQKFLYFFFKNKILTLDLTSEFQYILISHFEADALKILCLPRKNWADTYEFL